MEGVQTQDIHTSTMFLAPPSVVYDTFLNAEKMTVITGSDWIIPNRVGGEVNLYRYLIIDYFLIIDY